MKKAKESMLFAVSFYLLMGFAWMSPLGNFMLDFLIGYDKINYDKHFFIKMFAVSIVALFGVYTFIYQTYVYIKENEE